MNGRVRAARRSRKTKWSCTSFMSGDFPWIPVKREKCVGHLRQWRSGFPIWKRWAWRRWSWCRSMSLRRSRSRRNKNFRGIYHREVCRKRVLRQRKKNWKSITGDMLRDPILRRKPLMGIVKMWHGNWNIWSIHCIRIRWSAWWRCILSRRRIRTWYWTHCVTGQLNFVQMVFIWSGKMCRSLQSPRIYTCGEARSFISISRNSCGRRRNTIHICLYTMTSIFIREENC